MKTDNLKSLLFEHPLLHGLPAEQVERLTGCVQNRRFEPGELLLREGQHHGTIFLIREGTVAIESAPPVGEPLTIETVGPGDVLGISWLTTAKAHFDCRARGLVLAFAIDQLCLQDRMREDVALGYALASRLLQRTYERLSRLRLQRLDLYR